MMPPNRFRVSRIPEMRSEVGGEPPRGPLPAASGMRPPWLKSTDGPAEVRRSRGRVLGGVLPWEKQGFRRREDRALTLKPNEGTG